MFLFPNAQVTAQMRALCAARADIAEHFFQRSAAPRHKWHKSSCQTQGSQHRLRKLFMFTFQAQALRHRWHRSIISPNASKVRNIDCASQYFPSKRMARFFLHVASINSISMQQTTQIMFFERKFPSTGRSDHFSTENLRGKDSTNSAFF